MPIYLVDITFNGEIMAQTIIEEDGTFIFQIPALEDGRWIGIGIGDLSATRMDRCTFNFDGFLGPDARNVPNVGLFYDTALVKAP